MIQITGLAARHHPQISRSMSRDHNVYQSTVTTSRDVSLSLMLLKIILDLLLNSTFPKSSDVSLHCLTAGNLFYISRLLAKVRTRRLFTQNVFGKGILFVWKNPRLYFKTSAALFPTPLLNLAPLSVSAKT